MKSSSKIKFYFFTIFIQLVMSSCKNHIELSSELLNSSSQNNGICPSGYIYVPGNTTVDAPDDFCVMKYEAKNVGGKATSIAAGLPWASINQADSKAQCKALGANYDLISTPEWMAIARNVENVDRNWTDNLVGQGCLKLGNVGVLNPCTGGDSGYDGADPEDGSARVNYNSTAELFLDNGQSIFDFSGNIWEWTDWTLGGSLSTDMTSGAAGDKPYVSTDGGPISAWRQFSAIDMFSGLVATTTILPSDSTFNSAQGMGRYFAGVSGGATRRGGNWYENTNAGIYAIALNSPSSRVNIDTGFRCVYRIP